MTTHPLLSPWQLLLGADSTDPAVVSFLEELNLGEADVREKPRIVMRGMLSRSEGEFGIVPLIELATSLRRNGITITPGTRSVD
jgi:hypothetical protein